MVCLGRTFNAASLEYSLSMANVLKFLEENGIVKLPRYAVDKTSVILKSQCAFVRMVLGCVHERANSVMLISMSLFAF